MLIFVLYSYTLEMINYWVYSYFVINIYKVTVPLVNLQIHRLILRKGQIKLQPKYVVKGQPCAFIPGLLVRLVP